MKRILDQVGWLLGLKRNTPYVKRYLDDANMRSGIFMSAVIVILEIWLVIRQTNKYVVPSLQGGADLFQTIFTNLWTYFLLMSLGTAMLIYCIQYHYGRRKPLVVTTIVFSSISLILCCFMPFEFQYGRITFSSGIKAVRGIFNIILYFAIILFDISIIYASLYRYKGGKNPIISSVLVISLFALVCLTFGITISYGDFVSSAVFKDDAGNIITITDANNSYAYQHKQIICFLMMCMYVGCLLIWKPLVSFMILGSIFLGFHIAIDHVKYFGGRLVPEGDVVNYITFFISLTMICFSIYHQRISEATKDEELEIIATQDKLTGLYSFEYFLILCKEKTVKENIQAEEYIYLFLNITDFKILNDQRGFIEGNAFLKGVGEILTKTFPNSLISRQSDDHFVLFTENNGIEGKLHQVNLLVEEIDIDVRPGVKVGGYVFRDKNEDPHQSIEKARYACAELRHSHWSYLSYDKEMHDHYRLIQYVVSHIDEAIENKYLKVYYQPVVYSKNRRLCSMEALCRWIDPKYGFLSPGVFIPALENAQVIYKLDIALLKEICANIRKCMDEGYPIIPVSINFSRLDFMLTDIVKIIDETVKEYGIPKDSIHVEITESALTDNGGLLKDAIDRLHQNGFAVWLDDFGSGYFSFNVLKDFSFDVLKLDMAFLTDFEHNAKSKKLISAVIAMAKSINMDTLCEGVETEEEAKFLKSIECNRLQGYLLSKPVPFEDIKKMIEEGKLVLSNDIEKI